MLNSSPAGLFQELSPRISKAFVEIWPQFYRIDSGTPNRSPSRGRWVNEGRPLAVGLPDNDGVPRQGFSGFC